MLFAWFDQSRKFQLAGARSLGTVLDKLFRRRRIDVRTPPPPAGPQVYKAVNSRRTRSATSFCGCAPATGWLPGIYARFNAQYPGIALQLHDALLEPCLDLVRRGSVDIGVAAKGQDMNGLVAEPLCEDHFYLVCRHDHPLAQHSTVHLNQLKNSAIIQLGKSSSIRQSLSHHAAFAEFESFLEVDHLATVTGLVAAGLGVSLVPSMTLFQFRHSDIKVIPLSAASRIKRSLYLIRRGEKSLSSAAQAFYDLLLEERSGLAAASRSEDKGNADD